jgi:hypothetical protein
LDSAPDRDEDYQDDYHSADGSDRVLARQEPQSLPDGEVFAAN